MLMHVHARMVALTSDATAACKPPRAGRPRTMIVLGLILLLIGVLVGIPILYTLGVILLIVGVVLALMGRTVY